MVRGLPFAPWHRLSFNASRTRPRMKPSSSSSSWRVSIVPRRNCQTFAWAKPKSGTGEHVDFISALVRAVRSEMDAYPISRNNLARPLRRCYTFAPDETSSSLSRNFYYLEIPSRDPRIRTLRSIEKRGKNFPRSYTSALPATLVTLRYKHACNSMQALGLSDG